MSAGVLLGVGPIVAGMYLAWRFKESSPESLTAAGYSLVSGGVVALAIFVGESIRDARLEGFARSQNTLQEIRTSTDLGGRDFSARDLRGIDFSFKRLVNCDFTRANLEGAIFTESDVRGALFVGARMRRVRFTGTNARIADFSGSSLDDAVIVGCDIRGADFSGATMRLSAVVSCSGRFLSRREMALLVREGVGQGTRYPRTQIDSQFISQAGRTDHLRSTRVTRVQARGADWCGTDLTGADLSSSIFREACFDIQAGLENISEIARFPAMKVLMLEWIGERGEGLARGGHSQRLRATGLGTAPTLLHAADLRGSDFGRCAIGRAILSEEQMRVARF
ncbi:pentapeptide repeat-containing protein [Pedococcus soli]